MPGFEDLFILLVHELGIIYYAWPGAAISCYVWGVDLPDLKFQIDQKYKLNKICA